MRPTIFEKIIQNEIPSEKIYEDNFCLIIKDINPQADLHFLCIPKTFSSRIDEMPQEDMGRLVATACKIAKQHSSDFRLVCNSGKGAGMEIEHTHIHILAWLK